jgi:polar amino acid transport system substrate-binding protein
MMRPLVALLLLLFPSLALAQACAPKVADAELVTPGTLTMSTNPTLPPMQFVDQDGVLKGMRIELGAEIAKRLCLKPDFVKTEFDSMIPGLASKRWDMIDTGMFYTDARAKIVEMVRYEQQAISVTVPRGNPMKVTSIMDLAGHSVGVEQGGFEFQRSKDMAAEIAAKGGKPLDVRAFNNFGLAFQALKAGQVDGVVSIDSTAKEYQDRGDFTQALSGLYATPIAFATRSKPLAEAVAAVLTDMRKDGSFAALLGKYGVKAWDGPFDVVGPN